MTSLSIAEQQEASREPKEHSVVIDIDGVLCDNTDRLQVLKADRPLNDPQWMPDWGTFYDPNNVLSDPPIEAWVRMVKLIAWAPVRIVLLTNRGESLREVTEQWLERYDIPYDELRMRDNAHYNESKRQHLDEMIEAGYVVHLAVDDDPFHGTIFQHYSIPFIQVPSGYYDDGRISDDHLHARTD